LFTPEPRARNLHFSIFQVNRESWRIPRDWHICCPEIEARSPQIGSGKDLQSDVERKIEAAEEANPLSKVGEVS
jgi:hypothetical protein